MFKREMDKRILAYDDSHERLSPEKREKWLNKKLQDAIPAGLSATYILDPLGITVVPAGVGQTELQVQIMRELGVTGYNGFPTFLMTTIKKAEEMGYDFRKDFKLRWASVSGERHGQLCRYPRASPWNSALRVH